MNVVQTYSNRAFAFEFMNFVKSRADLPLYYIVSIICRANTLTKDCCDIYFDPVVVVYISANKRSYETTFLTITS